MVPPRINMVSFTKISPGDPVRFKIPLHQITFSFKVAELLPPVETLQVPLVQNVPPFARSPSFEGQVFRTQEPH